MVAVSLAEVPRGGDTPAITANTASNSGPAQPFTALATTSPSKRSATPPTNNTVTAKSAAAAVSRQGNTSAGANTMPSAQLQQQNILLSQPITGFPAALLHLSQFSGHGYESEGNSSLSGATPRTNQGGQYSVSHAALQARLLAAAAAADTDVSGGGSGVHGMGWGNQGSGFESRSCAGSFAPAWIGFHTTSGSMDLVLMMGGGVGGEGGIYAGRRGVGGGAGAVKRKGAAAGARGGGVEVVLPSLLASSTT